ncbi:MAG: PspA/IM30 family protein [Polyangiaceae bacterium]
MGIFNRMGKVISSNVNSLIDKAEDPSKSIELLVEEMKDQVRAAKKELIDGIAAEKVLRKKVEDLDGEVEKWDKRAELAMRADDEKLAREALVQKTRVVGERDRAEALRAEQRAAVLAMKAELERMEAKQQEYEARKGTIVAQLKTARATGSDGSVGKGGTAFDEFKRMEDKIDHAHEEVAARREVEEALSSGTSSDMDVESKFRQLEGKDGGKGSPQIDDELAQLKKKIRIGT